MKKLNAPTTFGGILTAMLLAAIAFAWTTSHAAEATGVATTDQVQPARPAPAGGSVTLLPNGTWLVLGGEEQGAPTANGYVYDAQQGLLAELQLPAQRSGHSATVLPDGRVLIVGGFGVDREIVHAALTFEPATGAFDEIAIAGLAGRAEHTATLLTDGQVLIAGGIAGDGSLHRDVELIDTVSWRAESIDAELDPPRYNHLASLMPASTVLLWGGFDEVDRPLPSGSLYDPAMGQFFPVPPLDDQAVRGMLDQPGAPVITGGIPPSGAVDFPVDGRISVRFSTPMDMPTLNGASVVLHGPTGVITVKVVPAEGGRLVFVTPVQQLLPASQYTLFLSGAASATGERLAFSAISFKTAVLRTNESASDGSTAPQNTDRASSNGAATGQASGAAAATAAATTPDATPSVQEKKTAVTEDDEEWIPGPQNFRGNWRAHRQPPAQSKASPPQAASGVTGLSGQVLRLNGKPLANVTLSVGGKSARTDSDGYFLLSGVAAGKQTLTIDGATANRAGATYGFFESLVQIEVGRTIELPFTIWMPRLDTHHTIRIPSPTTQEVVLSTPRIPGFELHIPAGVVIRDRAGKVVTEIGITPIPVDRTPFPQAYMDFPVYYTVQPGGAFLQGLDGTKVQSARLVYPNYTQQPTGQRADFWLYDPVEKGWYVYGQGAVSTDGASVLPDAGVGLYEFTGGGYNFGADPPPSGPPPCDCGCTAGGTPPDSSCGGNNPEGGGGDPGANPGADWNGDPVNLPTGLFVHAQRDLTVRDIVPLSVTRVYRQNSSTLGLFGIGTSSPYDMYIWTPDPTNFTSLVLVLANGGQVSFPRISGSGLENGVFQHTGSPSVYYASTIKLIDVGTGHPDFVLTLNDGRKYVFHHHGGKLDSFTDRNGNKTTINRNGESGPITSIVGPTGRTLSFTSNSNGTVAQISDVLGRAYGYTYLNGYLQTATDPENGVWHYTYDANNRMRTVQDPVGNVRVTNDYDANGRVSKQTYADGSTMQFAYTLDANGKVTQTDVTDQRGSVRRVAFNSIGHVTSSIYPLGKPEQQTWTFTRDATSGLVQSKTDPLGRTTTYTYDVQGNLLMATQLSGTPNAVTTTYTYESAYNQITSVTDPLGHTWRFTYDATGNQVSSTDPIGNTTSLAYNGLGQATSVTDPLGNATQLAYDASDLTSIADPLGRVTTTVYDLVGREVRSVSPIGHATQIVLDKLDRVTQVTDPLTGQVNFIYDGNGNLSSYSDQRGNTTSYTYNTLGKRATRTDALTHADSTLYDVAGKFLRFTDRKSQVSGATYDNMNRLTQIGFGATVGNPTVYQSTIGYSYDNGNRLTQAADSTNGSITRSFDGLDRLTQEQTLQGAVSYTYDAASRRIMMTVAGQPTTNYTYDNGNRLTRIQNDVGTVSFTYDAAGRRTTTTLANGVVVTYGYDNASQLTGITYAKGSTTIGNLSYTYDGDGRRTSVGGSLAQIVLPQALASAVYNANNQLTQWGGASYAYDFNGNLTGDGANVYTLSSRDQLTSLSGATSATFSYDAFWRRSSKTVSGTSTGFLYDGQNLIEELAGGAPIAILLTGPWYDEVYARAKGATTTSFLRDGLGSVLSLVDGNGTVTTTYAYESYGATTQLGNTSDNSQQFTGRENDNDGLMYYRARYYMPNVGRFISEDPIGLAGGANIYRYAAANPVSFSDPLGLQPVPPPPRLIVTPPGGGPPIVYPPVNPPANTPIIGLPPWASPPPEAPRGPSPGGGNWCQSVFQACVKWICNKLCEVDTPAMVTCRAACLGGYLTCRLLFSPPPLP